MSVNETAGTTLGVSTTLPSSFDAVASTGYPSETYLTVGNVENHPEFGSAIGVAGSKPVGEIDEISRAGGRTYPRVSVQVTYDDDDTGQGALEDNERTECAFAITYPDGSIDYVTGILVGFRRAPGGVDSMVMATVEIKQTRGVFRVDA